jgi:hypothetical protein
MVTKALFIFSYDEKAAAQVRLNIPKSWKVSTTWQLQSNGSYLTRDLFD